MTTDGRVGTILHAADLHLGAPLQALGSRVDPVAAERIRELALAAWDNLINLALDEKVDAVVLAGDVYDQAEWEVRSQLRFVRGLTRLTDAGTQVFIAHGNHDPLARSLRLAARLPEGVTVFQPGEPQAHAVELRSGHVLHVAGVSFGGPREADNLVQRFQALPTKSATTVGVVHTNVGAAAGHENYAPCTTDDLAAAPVGYWALGHIHLRTVRSLGPGRWWAYPGNLQGRSAKASECGPKGALLVPVHHDGFGEPEFRALAEVRFERVQADVSGCADVDDVVSAAVAALPSPQGAEQMVVCRLELVGRTGAHADLTREGPEELLRMVQDLLGLDKQRVVTKVEVATRSVIDRAELVGRGGITAAVLATFDAHASDPVQALEGLLDGQAGKRLVDLLTVDPDLAMAIHRRAEQLVVDRLEEVS
jgi:DNA repair protein SbcD/Mre11